MCFKVDGSHGEVFNFILRSDAGEWGVGVVVMIEVRVSPAFLCNDRRNTFLIEHCLPLVGGSFGPGERSTAFLLRMPAIHQNALVEKSFE